MRVCVCARARARVCVCVCVFRKTMFCLQLKYEILEIQREYEHFIYTDVSGIYYKFICNIYIHRGIAFDCGF